MEPLWLHTYNPKGAVEGVEGAICLNGSPGSLKSSLSFVCVFFSISLPALGKVLPLGLVFGVSLPFGKTFAKIYFYVFMLGITTNKLILRGEITIIFHDIHLA